jgi:hypothetical protein
VIDPLPLRKRNVHSRDASRRLMIIVRLAIRPFAAHIF